MCYIYFAIITLIIISIQLSKASNSYGGIILFIISMIWFVFDIYLIINS